MNPCIFCQIIAGKSPASHVYQDEQIIAFLDTQPVNPGHVLVVPRVHRSSLEGLPVTTAAQLMVVAQSIMTGLRCTDLKCEGINLFLADGTAAGQEIEHMHLHVIPRFAGDGFGLRLAPDTGEPPKRDELDKLAAVIAKSLIGSND